MGAQCSRPPDGAVESVSDRTTRLFEQHHDYVWATLRRLGVAESAADDVLQEVFMTVHRRHAELGETRAMRTWLFRIAHNLALHHHRSQRRHERRTRIPALEASPPGPDDVLAERQALELLDRVLGEMNPEQRAVFVLTEIEGVPGTEIAETLGLSPNTVHSRLRLAREKFQRALHRHHAENRRRLPWTA